MRKKEILKAIEEGRALGADDRSPWRDREVPVVPQGHDQGDVWRCVDLDGKHVFVSSRDLHELDTAAAVRRTAGDLRGRRDHRQRTEDRQTAIEEARKRGIEVYERGGSLAIGALDLLGLLGAEPVPVERPPVRENIPEALRAILEAALAQVYGSVEE